MSSLLWNQLKGKAFAGRPMFAPHDGTAAPSSFREFGNSSNLSFPLDGAETKRVLSNDVDDFRQTLDVRQLAGTFSAKLTQNTFYRDVLAAMFAGSSSDVTQSAETGESEVLTLVLNEWTQLAKKRVSAVAIAGKVAGTDFQTYNEPGLIMPLNAGTAESQTITYNCAAITDGFKISIAAAGEGLRGSLMFVGRDLGGGGKRVRIVLWDVLMMPDGEFSLINDGGDFGEASITAEIRKPSFTSEYGFYEEY